jgi:RNA polymerase sigma-70 factor, ECF subfamily
MHGSERTSKSVTREFHFGTNDSLPPKTVTAILPSPRALLVELYLFDGEYVQRLRDGDSATETHFVAYFRQLLRIKLRARYLSSDVIEDLQQETFIRVFRALRVEAGIRQPERIGAFVNSVCNFVLQEHYRAQGKKNHLEEGDADPPDKILNLEKLAIAEEVNERVREAVKSLSPRERDLIRKIFFLEMEKEEVCAELGVSRDYLRVLLHRAIEHLRDALENKDLPPKTREHEKKRG